MNYWDILILLIIALCIGFALWQMRRRRRQGCAGCCTACHSACHTKASTIDCERV